MNRFVKVASSVTLAVALLAPAFANADDKDVIDYRQHIMKSMDADTVIIGQIVSGATPIKHLAEHFESLALSAGLALKSFEANVPGGNSKPEVWTKWEDFSKRMKDVAEKTAKLAEIAKAHSQDDTVHGEIMNDLAQALACKSCHDPYRAPK